MTCASSGTRGNGTSFVPLGGAQLDAAAVTAKTGTETATGSDE
jgi:hypothetical protein